MLTTWPYKRPLGHAHCLIFMTQAEIIWQLKGGGETVCWSVNVCVFYVWLTVSVLKKNRDIILLGCDEISTRLFFACKSRSMLLLITIWLTKQCQNMATSSTSDDWYYQNFKSKSRIIQWWWWWWWLWYWWWKVDEMMKTSFLITLFEERKSVQFCINT